MRATAEIAACGLVVVVSAVFFALSLELPSSRVDPGGPSLWPQIMALGAGGGAVALLAQRLLFAGRRQGEPASGDAAGEEPTIDRTLPVMVLSIAYPAAILTIGFLPATLVVVAALMRLFGGQWLETLLFAAVLSLGLYVFFVHGLDAVIPSSWLEEQLLG